MLAATRREGHVEFAVSVVRLQTEMATSYARELQRLQETGDASIGRDHTGTSVRALSSCLAGGIPELTSMLEGLDRSFADVRGKVTVLLRELRVPSALHSKGKIEAAAGERTDAFHVLLYQIGERIAAADAEVAELRSAAEACRIAAAGTDQIAVREHQQRIEALASGA